MSDTTSNTTSDTSAPSIALTRTFAAPPELVWATFAEAEHFAAWYGPTGARIPTAEMDVRVGGSRFIAMEMDTPNGPMTMWFTGEFRVVEPPSRLVYTEALADATGRPLTAEEAGTPPGHPTVTEVTVELSPSGDSGTRLHLTHAGIPAGSPGEMGWNMALDKLADRLAS